MCITHIAVKRESAKRTFFIAPLPFLPYPEAEIAWRSARRRNKNPAQGWAMEIGE